MTRTLYLSGPMAGLPDHGYRAFEDAARTLRRWGFSVLSPREGAPSEREIQHAMQTDNSTDFRQTRLYRQLMGRAFEMVLQADAVVVLPGWGSSHGASAEVFIAHTYRVPVVNYSRMIWGVTEETLAHLNGPNPQTMLDEMLAAGEMQTEDTAAPKRI